jgi:hypothetical protein
MSLKNEINSAEQRFRQAFERLKLNKPLVLKPGTPVSQNNVAKESGCDPSALKKSRFPSLVREIKAYVEINNHNRASNRQKLLQKRKARSDLNERLKEISTQRDIAQSQLVSAQRIIVDLTLQLNKLKKLQSKSDIFPQDQN